PEIKIKANQLFHVSEKQFEIDNDKSFIMNDTTMENLDPFLYYFSIDEKFFSSKNLTQISKPIFKKGLLVIDDSGNGKTNVFKNFVSLFKKTPSYIFTGYTANYVVSEFEKCSDDELRKDFERRMFKGRRYFDDLKTERIASNYGKVNIFKEILERSEERRVGKECR